MSQDWLARLRDSEAGWNEPAFPDRFANRKDSRRQRVDSAPEDAADDMIPPETDSGFLRGLRVAALMLLGGLAIAWLALVIASAINLDVAIRYAPLANAFAVLSGPLLLIGGLAWLLLRRREPMARQDGFEVGQAQEVAHLAAQAASYLGNAHAQLIDHTSEFAAMADQSASAILGAVQAMSAQSGQLEQSTTGSITILSTLSQRIEAMADALPRLEDRLATLGETLAQVGGDLGQRHDVLDQQLQATALIAEEARIQLDSAGTLITRQLDTLRDGARDAGDELASLSELSSARLDLTLDRVKTMLDTTEQRIEAQNAALIVLVEKARTEIEGASDDTLVRFADHCSKIGTILDTLDARIISQAEKSGAWLESTGRGATLLAGELNQFEKSALARTQALSSTMKQLSGDTGRLVEALESGAGGADVLIKRAEALLVALDSGVRELDESIPAAIGRVETQLGVLNERIRATNPAIEAVEAVATGVVSHLHESDQLAKGHVQALSDAMLRSQEALAAQKSQVEALAGAVSQASDGMARLGESVGPQMVEALVRVRETADAAASRARAAIMAVIPETTAQLGEASSAAVGQAVTKGVTEQLDRLSGVADEAVMAAHRATDKLTRQMLSLTDASKELERTIAGNAERIDGQDRELMAHRSAKLITSLNERAIDVNKWLDKDVSEADWTAYLKGDQGLFARRATRLISGSEAKHVHALYSEDPDFREHVNRYVHDFESLLRTVMATRDGSTLALTMVSSDIGKLYVALAQAIERLRSH